MGVDSVHWALAQFQATLLAWPLLATTGYVLVFTLLTALCLPGAAVLLLLAGACFGLTWGCVIGTFASSAGATLTMLAARHWLRERVEGRFSQALGRLNQGLAMDGAWYLLSLRLLPVIPFVIVNLASGLTRLPASTFLWVSALGMLPGTAVYVNAGVHLAEVRSLDGLLDSRTLVALALLAVLPLAGVVLKRVVR